MWLNSDTQYHSNTTPNVHIVSHTYTLSNPYPYP